MLYSYRCPGCEWVGDRILKIVDRDEQVCGRVLRTGVSAGGHSIKEFRCWNKLIREEIALIAKLGDQWSLWNKK